MQTGDEERADYLLALFFISLLMLLESCAQIQKLLELMGMAKYQRMFMEAEIDGSILMQCDDKTLQEVGRAREMVS